MLNNNSKTSSFSSQKGSALFFVMVVLAIMTSALLSLIALSVGQIKGMLALSDSVVAFTAADTGIERSMYRLMKSPTWSPTTNELVYPESNPPTCPSIMWETFGADSSVEFQACVDSNDEMIFRSVGNYKPTGTKRKIEIVLE
ncbi:MAG: pilus assembly PilX N-terminal domain-containing protein [Candidatus Gribaldobacteria bacterium]|nr:pilus assembly PilX N-terminal domain-containing protein [Candidatus Gribaldobacteria bacterium]